MHNSDFTLIPCVSVQPHYIAIYNQPVCEGIRKFPKREHYKLPDSNLSNGIISNRAASKIKKAINWLLLIAKDKEVNSSWHGKSFNFKLSFITLTLSSKQIHSDNEIKKLLLNHFLIEARKRWGVKNYLWRAESQSNGNIHFHVLCDKFIPWSELRDTWNRIQNKLGYIDRYREEMLSFHSGGFSVREDLLKTWHYKKQLKAYRTGSRQDWNSPNSTDIHSIIRISNLPAYLSKYCTKQDKFRKIEGQLWNLSESLSCLKGVVEIIDSEISTELSLLCKKFPDRIKHSDYYTILFVSCYMWAKVCKGRIYTEFRNYIHDIRNNSS